jgi:regulator of sirC expression with transglutaminase-like and TPR domain
VAEDPTARFAALVARADQALPLDEAVILVAAHALPGVEVEVERARLDEIARGVPEPTVEGLRTHLVDDLGFTGDRTHYHDARNSLLPEVLDRRAGIPLTLAVVAMEVGRRCGVPLVGIGMPGHFLVRPAGDEARFLDLFDGGTELDRVACRAVFERLHEGVPWDDGFLDPVGPTAIVSRMLANLANAYRRTGDRAALAWAIDLRLRLPGATERDRRELAVLLGAAGRYDAAADVLEATGQERDQHSAARLRARLN